MNANVIRRRSLAVGVAAALTVPIAPTVAGAATGPTGAPGATGGGVTVDVGRLVLDPTSRGYQGQVTITVSNGSAKAVSHVRVTEPVAGSWQGTLTDELCMTTGPVEYRRSFDCAVHVPPGQSQRLTARFEVLTAPQPYPMYATGGQVGVKLGHSAPVTARQDFRTLFRSTSGSSDGVRPYRQDTTGDAGIVTPPEVLLTREADGRFTGWMRVSARWDSDAPHSSLEVRSALPDGMDIVDMDPVDLPVFATYFVVPGGRLAEGEERSFRIRLTAPAGSPVGTLGTGVFTVSSHYEGGDVPDRDPADDTASFTVVTAEA
ncbi:hypothetical protein O7606_23460 [Micromonospora sp. WMMD882]|uniref:hypothetical protein n=1 Tax=Micromonospora sp. WMMD882 TaxID=3015151 RepID=UPI00248C1C99|nr:hypothetical protein [Micromonospora sp. WMMD882]WBB79108.1 hypothetical protein O7606_23460 [Micromonospora sp. WMMD882]